MTKKQILMVFILALSIVLYITESPMIRFDRYGFADVDWADGLFYDGQFYEVEYATTDHKVKVTIDENMIDEILGKVNFTLNDHVSSGNYRLRNWDATFLEKGTRICSIRNIDSSKSIAALEDGIYFKYTFFESN